MPVRAAILAALLVAACLGGATAAHAAPPTVTYTLSGAAGDNGWFRSGVTVGWVVNFNGLPPVATTGCEPAVPLPRDTAGTTLTCRAENAEGVTSVQTRLIRIDQTPPVVRGSSAARPPDASGWYRAPVGLSWSGADAMSGIAGCTSLTYGGPDGPASVPGSCRDNAGNVSAPAPFALRYDATSPGLSAVTAAGGDTVATVRWRAAPDAVAVRIARSPGMRGAASSVVYQGAAGRFEDTGLRNRARYTYTVAAIDAAGNATSASAVATTVSRLRGPSPGARVTRPPVLRWQSVRKARYYNVQLYRGTQKVLSAWPTRTRLRLPRTWRHGGDRHRFQPGLYQWYVWPGYGRRAQRRYGLLLGTRRFAMVRPAAQ